VTLIFSLTNQDYAVVVSDRRFTVNGKLFDDDDDESNKAAVLICGDARCAVAFAGLAKAGSFRTSHWILETMGEGAPPTFAIGQIVEHLRVRATEQMQAIQTPRPEDKRLSVLLNGFRYTEDPPRAFCCLVSNFEELGSEDEYHVPLPGFKTTYVQEKRPWDGPVSLGFAIGMPHGVREEDREAIFALLTERRPSKAVVGKAVEAVQAAADAPASQGLVGKQVSSIIVPADPSLSVTTEYHTATLSKKVYSPDFVQALGVKSGVMMLRDAVMWTGTELGEEPTEVIQVPKVGRNQRCPCGSGRKYKHCHGRRGQTGTVVNLGGGPN
jgi:hypothetical protein